MGAAGTSPIIAELALQQGEDGSVVVGKILDHDTYAYGFDAQTGEFGNLVTKGIIDPTKVVRIALQDGASFAGLLITTVAMVAEKPKKETPMPANHPSVDKTIRPGHCSGCIRSTTAQQVSLVQQHQRLARLSLSYFWRHSAGVS